MHHSHGTETLDIEKIPEYNLFTTFKTNYIENKIKSHIQNIYIKKKIPQELVDIPCIIELLGETSVSHKQTFLWKKVKYFLKNIVYSFFLYGSKINHLTDLPSLDCPAVAIRLEDVMKEKSQQLLL